jgi:vacuolar protein sorting-associated protein 29
MNDKKFILVLGDLCIPYKNYDIPKKFKNSMKPEKISTILCTGNLCNKEQYNNLKKISTQIYCAKGDYDDNKLGKDGPVLKEYEIIQLGKYKVGISNLLILIIVHGHQVTPWGDKESLSIWQRKLNVDILISGHTHEQSVYKYNGKLFLNPGSN